MSAVEGKEPRAADFPPGFAASHITCEYAVRGPLEEKLLVQRLQLTEDRSVSLWEILPENDERVLSLRMARVG
jgi:hypothetical protein